MSTLNVKKLKGLKLKGAEYAGAEGKTFEHTNQHSHMTFKVSYNQSVFLHFSIYPLTVATTEGNHVYIHSTPRLCHQFRVQDLPQGHFDKLAAGFGDRTASQLISG